MTHVTDIDLLENALLANPFPALGELRSQVPVAWSSRWKGWYVSSHSAVVAGMKNAAAFRSNRISAAARRHGTSGELRPIEEILSAWLSFIDPPDHTPLRMLLNRSFTPSKVKAWESDVEDVVATAIGRFVSRPGRRDFLQDVAVPVPAQILAAILGVPAEDRGRFQAWSNDLKSVLFGLGDGSPTRMAVAEKSMIDFHEYFKRQIRLRTTSPQSDMLTDLAELTEDGALTLHQAASTAAFVVFGGYETTTNLIANSVHATLTMSDYREKLFEAEELPRFVDEMLRLQGPLKGMGRVAAEDCVLGNQAIAAGDRVLFMLSAANRDPDAFDQPDRVLLDRPGGKPIMSFGQGPHYCIGAALARLETSQVFRELRQHVGRMNVTDIVTWERTLISRTMTRLPVDISL